MKTTPLTPKAHASAAGYTLMEVMLAIGLIGLLVTGIFQTQRTALTISRDVTANQERSMQMNAFLDLMRRTFELTPGNSPVNLLVPRGNDGTSDLYFGDYPMAFAWAGVSAGAKGVILRTERAQVGNNVVVLYLDEEATQAYRNGNFNEADVDPANGQPRVRRLLLLEGVRTLIWEVQDDQKSPPEWAPDWPFENNRRPGLIRLQMEMMDGSEPIITVYWVPVVVQPQQFANASLGGGAGAGGPGGGGPTTPPININPPGVPGGGRPNGGGGGGGGGGGRPGGGGGR